MVEHSIAEVLTPSNVDLRNNFVHAIQTLKLLAKLDLQRATIHQLKKALQVIPQIPNGIFPFVKNNSANNTTTNSIDVAATKNALQQKLQNITTAKACRQELQKLETSLREAWLNEQSQIDININAGAEPPLPEPNNLVFTNFKVLSPEAFSRITQDSQTLLSQLGYDSQTANLFSELYISLDESIAKDLGEVYDANYGSKKGVYVDGVIFGKQFDEGPIYMDEELEPPVEWLEPAEQNCVVKPIGISDYRKVEATWKEYQAGEIAHIENLLKGENKQRDTRHLRRTEESYTIETIKESEVIRDLQTTERFALQKEASKVIQQDFEANVNAHVQGSYLGNSFGVSGGVSYAQSSTNSQMEASQYAKEVVDKSINRILERTREERTVRIMEEYEENNKHGLNNENGNEHVVGVYRWVDKIMQCKLANYGKRLLFEFMVPEPAAFHIFAKSNKSFKGVQVEKPISPKIGITNPYTNTTIKLTMPEQLDESNYKIWAGVYNAKVETYPSAITIGKAFTDTQVVPSGQWVSKTNADNSIKMPDGYEAKNGEVLFMNESGGTPKHSFALAIGDVYINSWFYGGNSGNGQANFVLDPITDTMPVSWYFNSNSCAAFNIEITAVPTTAKLTEWKMKTFQTIYEAYNRKLEDYNNAISEAQLNEGISIDGSNPLANRETEKTELKKSCLQLMTKNSFLYPFGAMKHPEKTKVDYDNYPYFDNCDAIKEGKVVKFFESIFDWNIMSYFLHPYFWGNRKNWVEIYNTTSNDPLHQSFLQAGYARVVVPIKLGYENIAFNFIESGIISYDAALIASSPEVIDASIELGQNTFTSSDPDYATSDLNPANWPTWEVRLPTNLVILQDSCPVDSATALPINSNL